MTPASLYRRVASVTVGVPGQEGRAWSTLRVAFKMDHKRGATPSDGELSIYNLSADSRAWCEQEDAVLVLRAGYDPMQQAQPMATIGRGEVVDVEHTREGTDWVTRIRWSDGDRAARRGRASLSVSGGTLAGALEQAVEGMAGLGVDVRSFVRQSTLSFAASAAPPGVYEGRPREVLQQLLPAGYGYTILDGELVLVPPDGLLDNVALVLDADSGMLGTPRRRTRSAGGRPRPDGIDVDSLLVPGLRPGRLVRLRSQVHAGDYVVRELEHRGDTHGRDWTTSMVLDPR